MRTLLCLFALVSLLAAGCDVPVVVADRPLVEPGDEKIMPEIAGVWAATDGKMRVKIQASDDAMTVALSMQGADFGDTAPLSLTKIRRQLYAQIPMDSPAGDHTPTWFPLRLTLEDADDATVEQLCSGWFKASTPEEAGLRYTILERQDDNSDRCMSGSVMLQASTAELRRWLRKHRDTEGLFSPLVHLRRQAPTP